MLIPGFSLWLRQGRGYASEHFGNPGWHVSSNPIKNVTVPKSCMLTSADSDYFNDTTKNLNAPVGNSLEDQCTPIFSTAGVPGEGQNQTGVQIVLCNGEKYQQNVTRVLIARKLAAWLRTCQSSAVYLDPNPAKDKRECLAYTGAQGCNRISSQYWTSLRALC